MQVPRSLCPTTSSRRGAARARGTPCSLLFTVHPHGPMGTLPAWGPSRVTRPFTESAPPPPRRAPCPSRPPAAPGPLPHTPALGTGPCLRRAQEASLAPSFSGSSRDPRLPARAVPTSPTSFRCTVGCPAVAPALGCGPRPAPPSDGLLLRPHGPPSQALH